MKSITSGERLTESATSQCILTTTDSIMTSLPANQKLVTTQEHLEKMLVEDKKKMKVDCCILKKIIPMTQ
jgi:hypothetical protein